MEKVSVDKISDLSDYADVSYNTIETICEKFGPRFASTEAEKNTTIWLNEQYSKYCDETFLEEFTVRPG
ncbi:MAG: hypothetical protein ACFFDW_13590, partial [Candidatus Thorarchaeota archaeon]